jgi:hypothetical protein
MVEELIAELRTTFLFEPFSEEQLYWLAAHATVESLEPGVYAFTETQPPDALWAMTPGHSQGERTCAIFGLSRATCPGWWNQQWQHRCRNPTLWWTPFT